MQPGDRIYSKVRHLWVRHSPSSSGWIGYLSLGDSVRVRGGVAANAIAVRGGNARCHTWYAVEPLGFACVGSEATLDPNDPVIAALRKRRANRNSAWPYRYAESRGASIYRKLPTGPLLERIQHEANAAKNRRQSLLPASAKPASIKPTQPSMPPETLGPIAPATPPLLTLPARGQVLERRVAAGSTLAFSERFQHQGQPFLLSWDYGFVPESQVQAFERSNFHGVALNAELQLPLAFFRRQKSKQWRAQGDGFEPSGSHWPRLAWVALGEEQREWQGRRYHKVRNTERWVAAKNISIVRKAQPPARIRKTKKGRRSWIDISITGGTLVAYEGEQPVYATLVSPGRGGMPRHGVPTLETASTPTGVYSVLGKFLTATMVSSSNASIVHAEVQYTQNFTGPYALHGAYWHDRFGEPTSGGCINLSPIDARRLFHWTDPPLPAGWHGLRTVERKDAYPLTVVYLHR